MRVSSVFVGGSDVVYLQRGTGDIVHIRRLLPIELFALQGPRTTAM